MLHELYIEAFTEGEIYFMMLMNLLNVKYVAKRLSVCYKGKLCNTYLIDDETYKMIQNYLTEEGFVKTLFLFVLRDISNLLYERRVTQLWSKTLLKAR